MLSLRGKVHIYRKDTGGGYLGSNLQMLVKLGLKSIEDIKGKRDCYLAWKKIAEVYNKNDKIVV